MSENRRGGFFLIHTVDFSVRPLFIIPETYTPVSCMATAKQHSRPKASETVEFVEFSGELLDRHSAFSQHSYRIRIVSGLDDIRLDLRYGNNIR